MVRTLGLGTVVFHREARRQPKNVSILTGTNHRTREPTIAGCSVHNIFDEHDQPFDVRPRFAVLFELIDDPCPCLMC